MSNKNIIQFNSKYDENNLKSGQKYSYLIPKPTNQLLKFIYQCDPELKKYELTQYSLENLIEKEQRHKALPQIRLEVIKSNPNFLFYENSQIYSHSTQITIQHPEFINKLMKQTNINLSQLTSLFYAHFFEMFFDTYSQTNLNQHNYNFHTNQEIRKQAMSQNNQKLLQIIQKYPTINRKNVKNFLEYLEKIN